MSFHIAAASWERAELWVQTNTTRTASLHRDRPQTVERSGRERQVGAASVCLGAVAGEHADLFQDTHVVSEQVRRHGQQPLQLGRGGLAQHERVDDGQPPRLTQGGVHGSSTHHVVVPLSSH